MRWVAACLAAACVALSLASCGGNSSEATAKAGVKTSTTTPPPTAHPGGNRQATRATGNRCAAQLGDVLDSMAGLRTRLVAGLAYEQYVGAVKSVLAAYGAVPVDELALACLRAAGTPAEKGINRYVAAGNAWTDCVEVPSCEAASIEAELQGKWKQASGYLSKAQRGLRHQVSG
ncbi:MAG: hypothetical protein QOI10_349 [Solirubrobacterales bacterium]|nr:hypothetical protein [Solirubrobacterales bacterium]